ncbi:hypothetical protein RAZWK3B_16665 [Roseobacter sp. AzwK-3b]|uniref:hypothetical protein n=1 Tax=Roseobacter sp. AzwK-3b TaxID=351016 RepID=UPI0001569885|nr:hypothetical protein [Roseobacter sp. AzwK-3b]EDM71048.1 hypothetical protein RAZWK3B_16665 [Roseobacter sp. AzwK-3b]
MKIEAQRNPIHLKANALKYLANTDWMIVRMSETGQPVPEDVLDARRSARDLISKIDAEQG